MAAAKETAAKLARAVEIGAEIEAIAADIGLQKLSRNAWLAMADELADGAVLAELRELISSMPYLNRVVHGTAQRWQRTSQDRPVADGIFSNGEGEFAPSYAERIVAGLSAEQCSAVAAVICAEQMPDSAWGRLGSFAEPALLLEPLNAELAELDEQLVAELRLADVTWERQGASLRAGSVVAVLDSETALRPASALATAARDHARGLHQVAA